jgi:hypothetical protein
MEKVVLSVGNVSADELANDNKEQEEHVAGVDLPTRTPQKLVSSQLS